MDPVRRFTKRQGEILALVAEGHSPATIAGLLRVAPRTVRSHIAQMALLLPFDATSAVAPAPSAYRRVLRYALSHHATAQRDAA